MAVLKIRNKANDAWYEFGNQGPQGYQGNQGYQGPQGYQGNVGAQGFQGVLGNQGYQGTQGNQGYQGNQGSTGEAGSQGYQGVTGSQGLTGSQGETGNQGDAGAQGNQGFQGSTGAQGDIGAQGATGSQGFQGYQGNQGNQGYQGVKGSQGFQGSQGSTGTQGDQGNTGATGAEGIVWRGSWSSAVAYIADDAISDDGTSYICILGHTNHQPPNATYWQILSLEGAQGSVGAQGVTGSQGSQGTTGSQGATGSQGSQGTTGAQGSTGLTGSQGDQGDKGFQGATGVQGSQGVTGSQGSTGSQGFQGVTGTQGLTGSQGSQGATGAQGTQGPTGFQGNQGVSGAQGATGAQGTQGHQGATGTQGATGSQGSTGPQGYQGLQGAQGLLGDTLAHSVIIDTGGYFKIGSGTKDADLNGIQIDSTEIAGQVNGTDSYVFKTDGTIEFGNTLPTLPSDEHLVGYWAFDDGSGSVAVDGSGNGNDGTLVNMEDADWVDGVVGKGLNFDGTHTEYVNLNAVNVAGASAGSISVWIKSNGAWETHDTIFYCGDGPAWASMRFVLAGLNTNQIYFAVADGTSSITTACRSGVLSPDTWYHIVGTYDGSNVKIYVTGELKDTVGSSIVPGAFNPSFTGIGFMNYSTRYWNGLIDEVRIYSTALTASEIKALYDYPAGV